MTGREGDGGRTSAGRTRRDVLAAAGATGIAGLAGCLPDGDGSSDDGTPTPTSSNGFANVPVDGDAVRIGVSVPQTGIYQGEGQQLLYGYELAANDINSGRGYALDEGFQAVGEDGGYFGENGSKEIELVTADTGSRADRAREAAIRLIDVEGAVVLTGGASSDEAISHQSVASDRGVVHMIGFAPGNSISGANCALTGFQEMFNAKVAAQAIGQVLADEYSDVEEPTYAQVTPNSDVGDTFYSSINEEFTGAGWEEVTEERTRVGTQNFEREIEAAVEEAPDVLVLNHYGLDGAFALRQAAEITEDTDVEVVVPLYNRPMAKNAGAAMAGVLGTVHWESSIREYSRTVLRSWQREYPNPDERATEPSGLVHLAYSQLFQYAAAVERAGSFEPPAVVDQLEGHQYNLGLGSEEMRACDHTATRPVPVVRGLSAEDRYWGRYYEVDGILEGLGSGCDEPPAAECELGSF